MTDKALRPDSPDVLRRDTLAAHPRSAGATHWFDRHLLLDQDVVQPVVAEVVDVGEPAARRQQVAEANRPGKGDIGIPVDVEVVRRRLPPTVDLELVQVAVAPAHTV